ncbi:ribonuclease HI family protein [Candidatus Daviesbacteria bacterium]|nr:ribonuclease HI family protein [Candidatus Daviesbacteria bacterium]
MELRLFTDGASRGNPGQASYGYLILDEKNQVIHQEGKSLGIATNNFAEYSGVLSALSFVKEKIFSGESLDILISADSKLVVEQLSGRFKIKSESLKPLIREIKLLEQLLGRIKYIHIPREKNKQADALANKALDSLYP